MVRQLTTSGHGVDVVVGKAGTGRTHALAAAHRCWQQAEVPVLGAAVYRQRVDDPVDNLLAQQQPDMPNVADRYGLHSGLSRHRPATRHHHVESRGKGHPLHAVR
ncbi:MAG: hypothetical protein QOH75_1574 [Actinomycetota bacterium]|jgi:1-aminocyclopropane-1-carboxylate deaminase/D-cysteine desulfhydrase-like pyridoxal-dependent ACC family enzyme|nr:hypothetical protein [Actinomycetota bacterium]